MPNWCECQLTAETKNEEQLKELRSKYCTKTEEVESIDLNKIKKTPEDGGWYEWRLRNWGTKWNLMPFATEFEKEKIIFQFDCAWSPCTSAIKTLSKLLPEIKFSLEYCEPGMCFAGRDIFIKGNRIKKYYTEDTSDQIFKDFGCSYDEEEEN